MDPRAEREEDWCARQTEPPTTLLDHSPIFTLCCKKKKKKKVWKFTIHLQCFFYYPFKNHFRFIHVCWGNVRWRFTTLTEKLISNEEKRFSLPKVKAREARGVLRDSASETLQIYKDCHFSFVVALNHWNNNTCGTYLQVVVKKMYISAWQPHEVQGNRTEAQNQDGH